MTELRDYFVHPQALCESTTIGSGTRIWAFAHVLPGAAIGRDCNVCDHVFIENDVHVGNRVTLKCGVQLWDGVTLEDDVFVGPNVSFTNDRFPRSKVYPESFARTLIRSGASLGANATILPGLTIGANAMIGAGAVVTRSVPANAIVVGNPAKIVGYVETTSSLGEAEKRLPVEVGATATSVKGVTLHRLAEVADMRGNLSVGECKRDIPFDVQRYFLVYDVPTAETRGEHAHIRCHQFLVAIRGSVHVVADDGVSREEFVLNRPSVGVYLPPMTWGIQYRYSSDAMLLVLASDSYDPADYIRSYDEFIARVRA
ncbi:WxcM-like domain-containing protein [Pseudomonas subflava]|uniref:WxcM-like domain-containing protein n=1 Tax=Pseudomonas subflava TaxID=2952933 RepID=UPI002079C052|nr:WxcM-like domain-containing protein [Pseudomonas subflava]